MAVGGVAAALLGAGAGPAAAGATAGAVDDRDVGVLRPLGQRTESSYPTPVAALPDGVALVVADDGVHGSEVWRTDGTPGGTGLLADLVPGPEGADPSLFLVEGDAAVFPAPTGALGRPDLWRTDGTAAGTARLAALDGLGALDVGSIVSYKNGFAFTYGDAKGVRRIGFADGATTRALDVTAPELESPSATLTVEAAVGGALYFAAGGRLYRTDGTPAGTAPVAGAEHVLQTVVAGDRLVVLAATADEAARQVLLVDGATATELSPAASPSALLSLGRRVYFAAPDGTRTWAAGEAVRTVSPFRAGSGGDDFRDDVAALGDGSAVFAVSDPDRGRRLLRSDGTAAGTAAIPSPASDPHGFVALRDGRVAFFAYDDRITYSKRALWVSDGTADGTRKVGPEEELGIDRVVAPTANGAVFAGFEDRTGVELHVSDGTVAGTGLLADLDAVGVGSDPSDAVAVGGRVVFVARGAGYVVWSTDGTEDGTVPLVPDGPGGLPVAGTAVTAADGGSSAYFGGTDGRLYRTDGTPAGTRAIADPGRGEGSGWFYGLGSVGSSSFLFGVGAYGTWDVALWRTDGTAAGTAPLPEAGNLGAPTLSAAGPGTLLIGTLEDRVVRSDGTAAGTGSFHADTPFAAVDVPDGFLAPLYDADHGTELQHLDTRGIPDAPPTDLRPGRESSDPALFGHLAGSHDVLFAATKGDEREWYVSDPSGAAPRKLRVLEGEPLMAPQTAGGITYLVNESRETGETLLYRTDGTPSGTRLLGRFKGRGIPSRFTAFAGRTYFSASDAAHGVELWETDGTPEGTRLTRDLRPGPDDGYPTDLAATDDMLFFVAGDGRLGREPWRIRRAAPGGDGGGGTGAPPVTVDPLPSPAAAGADAWGGSGALSGLATALSSGGKASRRTAVRVSLTVARLHAGASRGSERRAGGTTRWRVSGRVSGVSGRACAGRVRVVLGRQGRTLKARSAPLQRCAFSTVMTTTSRATGRWIEARTVAARSGLPAAVSRRAAVR